MVAVQKTQNWKVSQLACRLIEQIRLLSIAVRWKQSWLCPAGSAALLVWWLGIDGRLGPSALWTLLLFMVHR